MKHTVCPYCSHKFFTSIKDGKSCKECGEKIESVELESLTDIVVFPDARAEPAEILDKHMIDIPEYGSESARRAVALANVVNKARGLGANGVYLCRIISQSNLGYLKGALGKSRLPTKIACEFVKLSAESFRKERNRFQLMLMSQELRSAGIASIIWGLLNMYTLGTYSWSNLNPIGVVALILSYALIIEGIVLLVQHRPIMFVLDGMALSALGIYNVSVGLIATAGGDVSYLGMESHYVMAIGLGALQMFWGLKCFLRYGKARRIWQVVAESPGTASAGRENILEHQLREK